MGALVTVGIAVRASADNPWLERLLESLRVHDPGLPVEVRVEEGAALTKVEKHQRLLRGARTPFVVLLEDDVEALHPGWAVPLVSALGDGTALAGPLETRQAVPPDAALALCAPGAAEVTNLGGFCVALDAAAGLSFDPRIQTMSDLALSLRARAAGYRIARVSGCVLRHSKEPWASDVLPPWEQADRSRFGDGDPYYQQAAHAAKRAREALLLIAEYGDLARASLPAELLAAVEPGGSAACQAAPGCTGCGQLIPLGETYLMTPRGPFHRGCAGDGA